MTIVAIAMGILTTPTVQAKPCAAAKLEASGTYVDASLSCYAKAVGKGEGISAACLAQAEDKLTATFAKAESQGECATIGDVNPLKAALA